MICEVLLSVDYDKDQASQILGMDIKILNEKIKKYQIKDKQCQKKQKNSHCGCYWCGWGRAFKCFR